MQIRRKLAAAVALAMALLVVVPPAFAGQYDYGVSNLASGTYYTRSVPHDYSYLRGSTSPAVNTCVARGGGIDFCALGTGSHHYADPCNPSSCLSYYKHTGGGYRSIDIHDEWR